MGDNPRRTRDFDVRFFERAYKKKMKWNTKEKKAKYPTNIL